MIVSRNFLFDKPEIREAYKATSKISIGGLRPAIGSCKSCGFCSEKKSFPTGNTRPETVVVTRNPSLMEAQFGPYCEQYSYSRKIEELLLTMNIQMKSCYLTYSMMCAHGPATRPETPDLFKCLMWKIPEFDAISPRCLILFGDDVIRQFFGLKEKSIHVRFGEFYMVERPGKRKCLVLMFPFFESKDKDYGSKLITYTEKARVLMEKI